MARRGPSVEESPRPSNIPSLRVHVPNSRYFGLKVVPIWCFGAKVSTIWVHGPLGENTGAVLFWGPKKN